MLFCFFNYFKQNALQWMKKQIKGQNIKYKMY